MYTYIYLQTFCSTKGARIGLALSVGPDMAAISPPLHAVRAQHGLPSARAPRARLLSLAHPALILPKHSPVRPRLNCLLTLDCSRVPCSELTSSRSTARLFELIRRRPGSKGEVRSPNSNTRPPGPFHYDLYTCGCCCPRLSYHRPMLTLHPNHFTGPTSLAQNALTCVCSTACCAQFY